MYLELSGIKPMPGSLIMGSSLYPVKKLCSQTQGWQNYKEPAGGDLRGRKFVLMTSIVAEVDDTMIRCF